MRRRFGAFVLVTLSAPCALIAGCNSNPVVSSDMPSTVNPDSNKIVITARDEVLWNGKPVTLAQLKANLEQAGNLPVEPELQLVPEAQASYELSAEVLNVIKDSGVTKFGFVGNEKYRIPAR